MAAPVLRDRSGPHLELVPPPDDARRHALRVDLVEGLVVVERQRWFVPQGIDEVEAVLRTYAHAVRAGRGRRLRRDVRTDDLEVLGRLLRADPATLEDLLRQLR